MTSTQPKPRPESSSADETPDTRVLHQRTLLIEKLLWGEDDPSCGLIVRFDRCERAIGSISRLMWIGVAVLFGIFGQGLVAIVMLVNAHG